ncbi:MAG: Gx transporter family protein [Candidatus Latescibacteria bacterium]|nr:Gx transporter family protein [Candidatus Latescibacterota bacterium]
MCAEQGCSTDKGEAGDRRRDRIGSSRVTYLALLAAVGLVLFVFESLIAYPMPWMRLGLGNAATLLALFLFCPREAALVTLIRVVLGSLVVGRLFTPTFLLSLSGGLASLLTMSLVIKSFYPQLGPIGISISGALAHNLTQLTVVYLLWVKKSQILSLLPILLFSSLITGFVTGALTFLVLQKLSAFGLSSTANFRNVVRDI